MKTPAILLAALLVVWPAMAQQHPNQKKGFNANDVYQFNGLDSINTFNGNLVLTIPLGMSYSVGGGLSYQLSLISNANLWEGEEMCYDVDGNNACDLVCNRRIKTSCDSQDQVRPNRMHPHRRANAGFGWTVSLGRLYPPYHPALKKTIWVYETPDGADHTFGFGDVNGTAYSRDSHYLRMRVITSGAHAGHRAIDFPNGETHYFGPPETADGHWVLKEITNQFPANYLRIAYVTMPDGKVEWRLEDSHLRTHTIYFEPMAYDGAQRLMVKKVALSRFGTSTPAEINFNYTATTLNRGEYDTDPQSSNSAPVQRLDSVTFPDATSYGFTYEQGSLLDQNGVVRVLTLPTGGKIEWDWGPYEKPILDPHVNSEHLQQSYGVVARRTYGRPVNGTYPLLGTTTYVDAMEVTCNRTDPFSPPCREFRNIVTDPSGTRTEHYFSVSDTFGSWSAVEYGQPFTKYTSDGTPAPSTRWLSSRVYASGGTQPLRSTYVRYEHTDGQNWRPASTRVVYDQDVVNGAAVYMDSDSSNWDGYGHYRTTKTSGTIPDTPARESLTNYLAPGASWITGLYDRKFVKENGKWIEERFCFDLTTGFLQRKRAYRDIVSGTAGTSDLVAVYAPDPYGNVLHESYYGGDAHPSSRGTSVAVGTGDLCSLTLPSTSVYRINHSRQQPATFNGDPIDGTLTSYYNGLSGLFITDMTIDQRTGLVSKTRDTAGVETTYQYDWAGRLTQVNPAGRARSKYDYITPGNYELMESAHPAGTGSIPVGSTPLTYTKHLVDGVGRVVRSTTAMPGNTESFTNTVYDTAGRRESVSELGFTNALTQYQYDPFGRVKKVTLPDGSVTDYAYTGDGVRQKTRTSRIWTGGSQDSVVTTTENYDGYGRLASVTENSGTTTAANPIGAAVTTGYEYDVADRLTGVVMNRCPSSQSTCTQPVQRRTFDYDGRGFLRWESQPEAGMTSYLYDARGHVLTKAQGGTGTQFDLEHYYDAAERLTRIDARNPLYGEPGEPQFRVMKEFTFGPANATGDLVKGKLHTASRFNYGQWVGDAVYKVAEQYTYGDTAGRRTARTTTISRADGVPQVLKEVTMGISYDALDQRTGMTYPMCTNCGAPPVDPTRSQFVWSYDRGRFKSLTGFVNNVSYWPNGMRNVQPHANGIADTQTVTNMARPSELKFGLHERCEIPKFTQQPAGAEVPAVGNVTLSVTVTGSGTLQYEWWNATDGVIVGGNSSSISVRPSVTTRYYVIVRGACGEMQSNDAVVTVGGCTLPSTGSIKALVQPDGSWILTPAPVSRSPRTFEWRRLSDNAVVGTSETHTVTTLSQTTTFSLTVTDACGSATSSVTVKVPLPITTNALVATANGTYTAITVSWPAVSGATSYVVERRSGPLWEEVAWPTSTSWTDTQLVANRTYAYRVHAVGSAGVSSSWSNTDVATTRSFTAAVAGQIVTATPTNDMLAAVNSVRAALGWPALTWNSILALNDPVPAPGSSVAGRHVTSCRARMNEALTALGAPVAAYTDPETSLRLPKAVHINEVQERAR